MYLYRWIKLDKPRYGKIVFNNIVTFFRRYLKSTVNKIQLFFFFLDFDYT